MEKKEFRAESKRLLDLMINSIYTHREIFLRELISNASDAIDKIYYKTLSDENLTFDKENYYIKVVVDKDNRQLKVIDTGIGMTKEELEDNLGVIAKSGSLAFKSDNELKDGFDIIGQFGVGFYSAFMVADKVTVITKPLGGECAYKWVSDGADGYTIEEITKDSVGTEIILDIKENDDSDEFDNYLDEFTLKGIVKKYSDYIRYPIKMDITTSKLKDDSEDEYEEVVEEKVVNSMVPIWKKNKSELTDEDYNNYYHEKHFGFDSPLSHIHIKVDGAISYSAILYIPEKTPFDYYTKEYEKGLELYSNGVMIMNKCSELLPDYFSFVKGVVDSEDLSLNISREILQHDRQLKLIAKNIKKKIKSELLKMLKDRPEEYKKFYEAFSRQLKFGVYNEFGRHKEELQDLLMFHSSKEEALVTLRDYVERMPEDQKYIYYVAGDSIDRLSKMPQTEMIKEKGYEILYLTEDIDEFAIKVINSFEEKDFKSVSSGDLGIEDDEVKEEETAEEVSIFDKMKDILTGKVTSVKISKRLKTHPVCLTSDGELSIEMEKILNAMPDNQGVKSEKILEINKNHEIFTSLKDAYDKDEDKFKLYTELLYDQALLIEGLPIEDPLEFTNKMCKLMK